MFWLRIKNKELLTAFSVIATSFIVALVILLVQSGFASSVIKKFESTSRDTPEEWSLPNKVDKTDTNDKVVFGEEHIIYDVPDFIDVEPPKYLTYATTTNPPRAVQRYDLYIGEDSQNNLKLLHYKRQNYKATTTYPVYRIYPGNVSEEQIISDYKTETGSGDLPLWFGNQPNRIDDFEDSLQTENLVVNTDGKPILPSWLIVPDDCFTYMPQDNCRFEITSDNPFSFPAITLFKETGQFKWSDYITPYAIYVTNDRKILIRWSFGDAGASSKTNSLWDPVANTHIELSSVSGMYGEVFSLKLPQLEKSYVVSHDPAIASTTKLLKQNPFQGWKIYNETLLPDCFDIHFYPTNLVDYSAPWLLEYEYGCYFGYHPANGMLHGLSSWYELNPVTDSIRALTGVMPR